MARVIPDRILEMILDFNGSLARLINVKRLTNRKRIKAMIEHAFTRDDI